MEPDDPSTERPAGEDIPFLRSMPRPLIVVFLAFAVAGIGLVVWLMFRPPSFSNVALELRRSPPKDSLSHNVVGYHLVDVPSPLPATHAPCAAVRGVVIEGGPPAQARLGGVLKSLCGLADDPDVPADVKDSIHALARAKLRFALFKRTGDQTTLDFSTGRILIAIELARTNVAPVIIAPLLVHEGWHLVHGEPVTATQEFGAREAELGTCRQLIDVDHFPRGCRDALALVQWGEERAVSALERAGFPR